MTNSDKEITEPIERTGSLQKHQISLTDEERRAIDQMIVKKGLSERKIRRCKILALCDSGLSGREVVEKVGGSLGLVNGVCSRYLREGFELAVHGLPMGQPKRHQVNLTVEEHEWIQDKIESGKLSKRKLLRCNILVLFDKGKLEKEICEELEVSKAGIYRVRKRYSEDGIEAAVMGLSMGKPKKYDVILSKVERDKIREMVESGALSEKELKRCKILMLSSEKQLDSDISKELGVSVTTVSNTRKRFAAEGVYTAIKGLPIPGSEHMLTVEQCMQIKNIALSPAPGAASRWTMKLLAEQIVMDGMVEKVSIDTIRRALMRAGLQKLP